MKVAVFGIDNMDEIAIVSEDLYNVFIDKRDIPELIKELSKHIIEE